MILDSFFNRAARLPRALVAGLRPRSLARKTFRLSGLTLFVAALAISGSAHANTLPPPTVSLSATSAPGVSNSDQGAFANLATSESAGTLPGGGSFVDVATASL